MVKITKNKLEKLFSESMKSQFTWGMKLHNNPLSHQNTPADYIITHDMKVILVECKQVTCEDGKGRLAFKRLKQMHDLIAFESVYPTFHKAYFCIAYYDDKWAKSLIYLIPVNVLKAIIDTSNKESLNQTEAEEYLNSFKVEIIRGELQLRKKIFQ